MELEQTYRSLRELALKHPVPVVTAQQHPRPEPELTWGLWRPKVSRADLVVLDYPDLLQRE